jgi:four helix bundle protein
MDSKGLESLKVWQKARAFVVLICKELLLMFPAEEKFALSQQLRRAVQSVPANIAEAHGRYHYQDAIRLRYIARGSLDETLSHLILAHDLGYIPNDSLMASRQLWREVYRLLNGYIEYLKRNREEDISLRIRDEGWSNAYDFTRPDP